MTGQESLCAALNGSNETTVSDNREHVTSIEQRDDPREGLYPGLKQYRAACSCGWKGPWQDYQARATQRAADDGLAHYLKGDKRG